MIRVFSIFLAAMLFPSCASNPWPTDRWPAGDPYIRIERWSLAAGVGRACTIENRHLRVTTLNDFSKPDKILFETELSGSEFGDVVTAVEKSGLLARIGRKPPPAPPIDKDKDDVMVIDDGALDRFSFRPPNPHPVREASVEFMFDDPAADTVIAAINPLLPKKYRF